MKQPTPIRELLLTEIRNYPNNPDARTISGELSQAGVLQAVAKSLGHTISGELQQAILTEWGEMFRTGLLAWGLNFSNPNPPFFHLTERGRRALANVTRDPSNPAGYLRHLESRASLGPTVRSYVEEGLHCYVAGHFRSSIVMVGCAAEATILDLRVTLIGKLDGVGRPIPKKLREDKIKTVTDALKDFLDQEKVRFSRELREAYDANWSAFAHHIRTARNEAGHPNPIGQIDEDVAHAALLVFPELAKVATTLKDWIQTSL